MANLREVSQISKQNNIGNGMISIDIFNRLRRNISGRNTLYGYLSDDMWRDLEW